MQIRSFALGGKCDSEIVNEPLFEETPPPEESNFEEQLEHVLSDEPRMEIINELNAIRKHHNKSLQDFFKESLRIIKPSGVKGIE